MNKKEYPIPEELAEIMDEANAAAAARQDAVKCYFKFQLRNAIELGKIAIQKRNKFWRKVRELYPEIDQETIHYNGERRVVWGEDNSAN